MQISVIIPVYNAAAYLSQCLDSICQQSLPVHQVILVDDGSTDASRQICQAYCQRYAYMTLISQTNQGVSAARNAGLKLATGDYVMFVDSDDYLDLDCCAKLAANQSADLIFCQYSYLKHGQVLPVSIGHLPHPIANVTDMAGPNFLPLYEALVFHAPVCKLYKRDLIQVGFQQDLNLGEDLIFNLHFLKQAKQVSFVADHLYYYRVDQASSLSTKYYDQRSTDVAHVYQASLSLFKQLFRNDYNQAAVKAAYLKELCLSAKKLLAQTHLSKRDKYIGLDNILAQPDLAYPRDAKEWRKYGLAYDLFLRLLLNRRLNSLQFLVNCQSWLAKH